MALDPVQPVGLQIEEIVHDIGAGSGQAERDEGSERPGHDALIGEPMVQEHRDEQEQRS